jgi:hypothetical protein
LKWWPERRGPITSIIYCLDIPMYIPSPAFAHNYPCILVTSVRFSHTPPCFLVTIVRLCILTQPTSLPCHCLLRLPGAPRADRDVVVGPTVPSDGRPTTRRSAVSGQVHRRDHQEVSISLYQKHISFYTRGNIRVDSPSSSYPHDHQFHVFGASHIFLIITIITFLSPPQSPSLP